MRPPGEARTAVSVALVALAWATMLPAAGRVSVTAGSNEVVCRITHSPAELVLGRRDGFDTVRMAGSSWTGRAGDPALPSYTIRVSLPPGMRATGVREVSAERLPLPGQYDVAPIQRPTPIDGINRRTPSAEPDPAVHGSNEPWPDATVRLLSQVDLAGQSVAVLRVAPVRYAPAEGTLSLATSLAIAIEGRPGYVCGDYLPDAASAESRDVYTRMLAGMVVNPDDIELVRSPGVESARSGVDPGQYGYVIITDDIWIDDFQELADWRTARGVPSTIVSTDWIYESGEYAGTDLERVRAFVEDAHVTWGATDFLLGGDTNTIPYGIRRVVVPGYTTDDIPNDTYFADYDDDFVCEVNVGRASVRSAGEIADFIWKILDYEKSPTLADYLTTAAFFGFDIADPGDQYGEASKEYIRSLHVPPAWTVDTEYDSEPGTHEADVLAYLDAGYHLVNHHDHCNADCMGTGWISHGDLMYTSDISALTNRQRQSLCIAVGCYPCDFTTYTSIGEAFLKNPGGGGFAFMGNSRIGWGGSSEDPDWYTARQDRFFYRNLFDDGFVKLGANFSDLKNDEYDPDDPYSLHEYCFLQFHLLGDPAVPIWTDDPATLTVTHPEKAFAGVENTFPVEVTSGRGPVDGAVVCLWKDGDVYEIKETVGGAAVPAFTPAGAGTLCVTVTARNCLPYEAEVTISDETTGVQDAPLAGPALGPMAPNPFRSSVEIAYAVPTGARDLTLIIYDCAGRRVRALASCPTQASSRSVVWDGTDDRGRATASGIYFVRLDCDGERRTGKLLRLR